MQHHREQRCILWPTCMDLCCARDVPSYAHRMRAKYGQISMASACCGHCGKGKSDTREFYWNSGGMNRGGLLRRSKNERRQDWNDPGAFSSKRVLRSIDDP